MRYGDSDMWPEVKPKSKKVSSLDEKLREILLSLPDSDSPTAHKRSFDEFEAYVKNHVDEAIAQIKQAFADEGYIKNSVVQWSQDSSKHLEKLMTGQEWYDRFEKELETSKGEVVNGQYSWTRYADTTVLEAAKRAAGLSDSANGKGAGF